MIGRRRVGCKRLALASAFLLVLARAQAGGPADPETVHLGACGPVAGAFQLPGTDACLRLSGFVAADIGIGTSASHSGPPWAFASPGTATLGPGVPDFGRSAIGADARLSMDVRIPTDFGPARVFVSLRARHGSPSSSR